MLVATFVSNLKNQVNDAFNAVTKVQRGLLLNQLVINYRLAASVGGSPCFGAQIASRSLQLRITNFPLTNLKIRPQSSVDTASFFKVDLP